MARKRPSIKDITSMVEEIGRSKEEAPLSPEPAPPEPELADPETYWRKATIPYRQEQLNRLDTILSQWAAEKKVKVSGAEVLRLALEQLLERMEETPNQVILELYHQEQREQLEVKTRKYSRSRGAERYLRREKLI